MKNKFWIFMFNRRQYQIMPSSSLSYHQYTCSQFTLYECYVDGKLLIHNPSPLLDSLLSIPSETLDLLTLDQLFDPYSTATTSLLNSMLPQHPVKSRVGSKYVWFDDECQQARRRVRCAERHFRRTKDPDDHLSWIVLLRSLLGYTIIKKWHIGRIWSPGILRIRSACALPFLECLANPLNLWKRRPSPLQIFLTCSLPK